MTVLLTRSVPSGFPGTSGGVSEPSNDKTEGGGGGEGGGRDVRCSLYRTTGEKVTNR